MISPNGRLHFAQLSQISFHRTEAYNSSSLRAQTDPFLQEANWLAS